MKNLMMFIFGAAVGSLITYRYVKKKYELFAQEEIDSVKEVFAKREGHANSINVSKSDVEEVYDSFSKNFSAHKNQKEDYQNIVNKNGYVNYSNVESVKDQDALEQPYVISPDDFGEVEGYDTIGLNYFSDDILANDNDEVVDIKNTVGDGFITRFGEYEDDAVFVRNDRLKCDFEILRDNRKYSDVINKKPKNVRKPHEV